MRRSAFYILAGLACFALLVDEGAGQEVLARHHGSVLRSALSSDGALLASGDSDGMVRLWDAQTGARIRALGAFRWEGGLAGIQGGRSVSGRVQFYGAPHMGCVDGRAEGGIGRIGQGLRFRSIA